MSVSDQVPVASAFHAKSTAAEVLANCDLSEKTAIVTGGYSGLGLETVRALANSGAKVIVPARSKAKAETALSDIKGDVSIAVMDLAELSSVRKFAAQITVTLSRLDILINNAGIMACPETRIGPGWEAQFGVNHMGHFALVTTLMPLLQKTPNSRVVALSSTGHKLSDILWDDIQFEETEYEKWRAYGQAKTANALFANAMSRRLHESGGHAFSVHPGGIFTPLQRHLPKEDMISMGWLNEDGNPSEIAQAVFKTPEQGASTTLWAATSPLLEAKAGVYCEDCNIAHPTDPSSPQARFVGVNAHACDDESAEQLWELSEALLADA